jgi:uncharacterized Tic20 family protein
MDIPPPIAAPPANPAKPDSRDKLIIILCHLSLFLGAGIWLRLIICLVKKAELETVAAPARESSNCYLWLCLYALAGVFLCAILISAPLIFGVRVFSNHRRRESDGGKFLSLSAVPRPVS